MRQFGIIFRFELKNYFKNKIFVGVTIFLMVLIAGVMFYPRIMGAFERESSGTSEENGNQPVMYVWMKEPENTKLVHQLFAEAFPDYEVQITEEEIDWVKERITSDEAECAFELESLTSYTYYVNDLSMYDFNTAVADEILQKVYQMTAMIQNGISAEDAEQIMTMQIQHETESLGKDQIKNFFYTYIMIFALYMVILLYGQMVATNVATEKSSRAMELLITSAKPVSMMFGKVIASCLAGLIQLVAVFGSAFAFFNMNKSYWGENEIVTSIFDMPLDLLICMLIFFVLGFFIYAFLYGAIGSTASKVEDINTSVMPLTMLFIIAFFVVIFSMTSGSVDNIAMKICSYVPFTSPMAMFTRIAMSEVPLYEILISMGILVVSVLGVGVISAKIYRVGVLLYGTTPKLGSLIKAMKKA